MTGLGGLEPGDFTVCPDGRCGEVAEVVDVYDADSTGGPVRHVVTLCLYRHRYHQILHLD